MKKYSARVLRWKSDDETSKRTRTHPVSHATNYNHRNRTGRPAVRLEACNLWDAHPPTAVSGDVILPAQHCCILAGVVGTGVGRHLCSRARPRPVWGGTAVWGWASGAVCVCSNGA